MPSNRVFRLARAGLLCLSLLIVSSCGQNQQAQNRPAGPPPPAVSVANPVEKKVVEWDEYTGRFDSVDTVEVRARISGVLNEVKFTDGAVVKKGDLLFVIDPRPFQRVLDRDRAALQGAKVQVEFAQKDLERARPLMANSTISQQVFDQRNQAVKNGEANVLSAEASVRSAELDVEFTQITCADYGPDQPEAHQRRELYHGRLRQRYASHDHRFDRSDLFLFRYQRG